MAERFQGGSAVAGGYYLDVRRWAVAPVARDGDRLPPGPARSSVRQLPANHGADRPGDGSASPHAPRSPG